MLSKNYINQVFELPQASRNKILAITEPVTFKKGELIFKEDKIEKNIYIIQKGIARAYKIFADTEVTFWFGLEGDTIISIKNYVEGNPSYENIEAIDDILAYKINTDELKKMFTSDINIANWGRFYAETEMLKNEERLISRQFKSASERYLDLLMTNPELIKRIPLRYIASYLGITQVSLSRIRALVR